MNEVDLVGNFDNLPTFLQIVNQVAENAKNKEHWRIKEKLTQQMLD